MAIPTSAFSHYDIGYPYSNANPSAIGTREDSSSTLTMIDPDEAMSLAVLSKTTTNSLRHHWFTDVMRATSNAPALAGEDWGQTNLKALQVRTRLENYVEWKRQDWSILMDELLLSQRGQLFGVDSELDYQMGKAGQEVNRDFDARLWQRNTPTVSYSAGSGSNTVSATMATFRYWAENFGITATHGANGAAFNTAVFYDLQERMWTAGAKPDTLFVSPGVKSDISRTLLGDIAYPTSGPGSGIAGIPAVQGAGVVGGGEYGPVIDFIRTDFGRVAMVVDRWIFQSAATANSALIASNSSYFLAERSKLRVAWWRPIRPYQVASTGDNVKVYILGAATTEVLHPSCLGIAANVLT